MPGWVSELSEVAIAQRSSLASGIPTRALAQNQSTWAGPNLEVARSVSKNLSGELPSVLRHSSAASIGSFHRQPHTRSNCLPFALHLHIMSAGTGASIMDALLIYIGQRISTILLRSAGKDKNYITSLHNEVVSISQRSKTAGISFHQNLGLACCRMDRWPSVIRRQLPLCARVSQSCLSQFLGH